MPVGLVELNFVNTQRRESGEYFLLACGILIEIESDVLHLEAPRMPKRFLEPLFLMKSHELRNQRGGVLRTLRDARINILGSRLFREQCQLAWQIRQDLVCQFRDPRAGELAGWRFPTQVVDIGDQYGWNINRQFDRRFGEPVQTPRALAGPDVVAEIPTSGVESIGFGKGRLVTDVVHPHISLTVSVGIHGNFNLSGLMQFTHDCQRDFHREHELGQILPFER